MATLTFAAPTDEAPTVAYVATAPAGDKFLVSDTTKRVVLLFDNGHSNPITVAVVAQSKTISGGVGYGSGSWKAADRDAVIANGTKGAIIIEPTEIRAFLDADGYLNLAYTGGNAALSVLAFNL